ncbi:MULTISPECIES: porin [unclassified Undibacterium]|uniref:porin n=1 Tax=unclassified Undibacterium TaxID=2630295 RepID=UPI002AC97314|nr:MULTISPECIES: porin [unclassified Undibacterium]MEB0137668.1 porin [Undibacterium sp. CCC2.1]MEB0172680.1 porin [Undibacterium sp. CCC1.1]MEB0177382.1 porin [Undibacterium sp. CCC3.4]MEB0215475.1 porin [Undibacterium sp. 5I2]WPX42242.1 porin [Undibacterium sp. CCC3.4]
MKKTLLASALFAGLCSLSHAQSNVTIYGNIDQYLGYISSSSGTHVVGLNDGALSRSRLGFRGTEDLGAGYQAKFTLEQGLNANTGASADSNHLFDRQAWVGINTPYGEFRLGRQNTEIQQIGSAIDYTERTTMGSVINSFGVPSRYENDISYKSPRLAGFQGAVHYALSEQAGGGVSQSAVMQLGLDYTDGPVRAGYAGLSAKPAPTGAVRENIVYHNIYADYDYGLGKVYLTYARTNNVTANASGLDAAAILSNTANPNNLFPGTDKNALRFYNIYQASVDYRINAQWRVGTLYGVIKDTSGGNAGAKGGNVGAFYDMSKRTTIYGFANYMKNEANGGFRFSGSAGPTANLAGADINGQSLTGLQIGLLHRF